MSTQNNNTTSVQDLLAEKARLKRELEDEINLLRISYMPKFKAINAQIKHHTKNRKGIKKTINQYMQR